MLKVDNVYMTWEEMKLRYPDKWVVAINPIPSRSGFLQAGNVIMICEDNEIDNFVIECYRNNLNFDYRRTTDKSFMGVLNVEGVEFKVR